MVWGRSSVDRAPHSHCGGRGFDSHRLHHKLYKLLASNPRNVPRGKRGFDSHRLHHNYLIERYFFALMIVYNEAIVVIDMTITSGSSMDSLL